MLKDAGKTSLLPAIALLALLLAICPLATSTVQSVQAETADSSTGSNTTLYQKIPLTNQEIRSRWPKLPSAEELLREAALHKSICVIVDLRYCGKQFSSMADDLPDPNSPTILDISSMIANCTIRNVPDMLHGGIMPYVVNVWLRYNSSIWVLVPYNYLVCPEELQPEQVNTWAIGMYNNPSEIAGSAELWGACTFGQFPANSFGTSGYYLGVAVLSVSSSNFVYQLAMQLDPSGKSLVMNVWNRATGQCIFAYAYPVLNAATRQLYNMYIRYSSYNSPYQGWQLWWNWSLTWVVTGDSSTRMLSGDQPNVVVESNDFNPQHFQGFSTTIGGTYTYQGVTYPLAATCFLFNGNWVPSLPGQNAPAGRVYLGGYTLTPWGSVGTQPPPSNWGSLTIGEISTRREVFTVGVGLPQPNHGYLLWSYGPV